MIEVTVAYPAGQGRTFNMDYYLKTHIPLFQKRMGAAMKTIRVSRGGSSMPVWRRWRTPSTSGSRLQRFSLE